MAACAACFSKLSLGAGPVEHPISSDVESLTTASAWSRAARKLLYRFKINNDPDAGVIVRRLLKHHRDAIGFGGPYDAVVPVPPRPGLLNRSRAADKIAREVAGLLGVPVARVLTPTRRLKKQSSLGRAARAQNVHGAFRARPAASTLQSALVVDDVVTTGATARECAAALKKAGVRHVSAFALARGGAS